MSGERAPQDARRHRAAARLVAGQSTAQVAARRTPRLALGERLGDARRAERVTARQPARTRRRTQADGAVLLRDAAAAAVRRRRPTTTSVTSCFDSRLYTRQTVR